MYELDQQPECQQIHVLLREQDMTQLYQALNKILVAPKETFYQRVTIDFEGIDHFSTPNLAVLIIFAERAKSLGMMVYAKHLSKNIKQLFDLVSIANIIY